MSKYEHDRQAIGIRGYEVFMYDSLVVMTTLKGEIAFKYTSKEALALLAWLFLHRDELFKVALLDETQKVHRYSVPPAGAV